MGAGMEETYQLTAALKYLEFGKYVAVLTDARFSGVSAGACIGHISLEALAGGPLGKLRDGDRIEIVIDRNRLEGSVNLVGANGVQFGAKKACAYWPRTPASRASARSRASLRHPPLGRASGSQRRLLGRLGLRHRSDPAHTRGRPSEGAIVSGLSGIQRVGLIRRGSRQWSAAIPGRLEAVPGRRILECLGTGRSSSPRVLRKRRK